MTDRKPQALLVLVAALALLLTPARGSGQGVAGMARDALTGAPLPGVVVTLSGPGGQPLGSVLTDPSGEFAIRGAPGLNVIVRAERIGLQSWVSGEIRLATADMVRIEILMEPQAFELGELVVGAPVQTCQVDPVDAVVVQRWWDEARKALAATAAGQQQGLTRFRVYEFERDWDAAVRRVTAERGERTTTFSTRPFVARSARELADEGYIVGSIGSRRFLAPDAAALLSAEFLEAHCFGLDDGGDETGLLGITFRPVRSTRSPDIYGTFRIDTLSAELRDLQFRYSDLPADLPVADEAGGTVRFRYLPNGAWIVSEWWVRVPVVGLRNEARGRSRAEVRHLVGYRDYGGRARDVRDARGVHLAEETGGVRGAALGRDGEPVEGVRIVVSGTRLSAPSGADGTFAIDSVPAGSVSLVAFQGRLTDLGYSMPPVEVEVGADRWAEVLLQLPGDAEIIEQICGIGPDGDPVAEVLLSGRVESPAATGIDGVRIQARWQEGDPMAGLARERHVEATTGSGGRFAICRLPIDIPTELRAFWDERWHVVGEAVVRRGEVAFRRIVLPGAVERARSP
ncbi:MAG: carboxypeptidase regulatory-like domain-containing protein [Longimicrobiales bacterium]